LLETALLPVAQRLMRCIPPGCSGNSASGMRSCSAEIESVNGRAVLRPSSHGTHKEKLLQAQIAMEDVALGQTIGAFQIQRRKHLPGHDRLGNVGCVFSNLLDYAIAQQFALVVPVSLSEMIRHILHEARMDMLARRRQ